MFQYEEMNNNQRRYMGGGWALGPHLRFEILSWGFQAGVVMGIQQTKLMYD